MPAFVFATRAMREAALPLLDDLAEAIAVVRNPSPDDPRPIYVLGERQLAQLRPRFAAAGVGIVLIDGRADADSEATLLAAAVRTSQIATGST